MDYIWKVNSPLGIITLASDGENLTGLWLENQKYYAATLDKKPVLKELNIFKQTEQWLDVYFKGKDPKIKLSLAPKGSEFRQDVWKILLEIPYGKVKSKI